MMLIMRFGPASRVVIVYIVYISLYAQIISRDKVGKAKKKPARKRERAREGE